MDKGIEISLLSYEDVFTSKKSEIIRNTNAIANITDFAIARGCYAYIKNKEGYIGNYNLINRDNDNILKVDDYGNRSWMLADKRTGGIRPIIKGDILSIISKSLIKNNNEIEYGEYPAYSVENELSQILTKKKENNTLTETLKN